MENDKTSVEKKHESLDQLESRLNTEVADFFNTNAIIPKVTTFDSKTEFDKFRIETSGGKMTEVPDWLVAFAMKRSDDIYILLPDIIPAGMELDGYTRFEKTLKHEIGHLYTKRLNSQIPSWLNEGISLYLAEQDVYKPMKHEEISIELLDKLEDTNTDPRIYQVGYNMAMELVKLGGKELLLEIAGTEEKIDRDIVLVELLPWLKK